MTWCVTGATVRAHRLRVIPALVVMVWSKEMSSARRKKDSFGQPPRQMKRGCLPEVIEHKFVSLANHPVINETWVHQCIIKKPEILGLGNLVFLDHE